MRCAICGKKIENEFGNNPWPVRTNENARCCDDCNNFFVIPYRIILMHSRPERQDTIIKLLNETSHERLEVILNKHFSD